MTKKAVLTLIMALAFISAFAQFFPETKKDFFKVYQETLELNAGRFADINLIQIGDTVLLPGLYVGNFTTYWWVADAPEVNNGRHDCLWLISERYYNQDISKPMVVEPVPIVEPLPVENKEESKDVWPFWFIGLMAALIILYFIITEIRKHRPADPNANPMIAGGLSPDDATAVRQIARDLNVDPENITKTERCMLVRHSGPKRIEVLMDFRNGQKKSYVLPGELVTRVTIEENGETRVQYWRNHCGNRFGQIKEGQFELPEGWEVVVQSTYDNPATQENDRAQQPTEEVATKPAPEAKIASPSFAPTKTLDTEDVATILRGLPKGVAKVEIKKDGITIQMNPKKAKRKK